jgi:hypothetical protein
VKTTAQGQSRWQMREISGGSGYGSQNAPYAYFGLGAATNIDIVRVEWSSGVVQELYAVSPRQSLTVTEPVVSISPGSLTLNRGETATFTANTTLSPPLSFQWFHDGIPMPAATAASLVITNVQARDAGNYSLQIEQTNPRMSVVAKSVSLVGPIVFQTAQQFLSARPGTNVTFQAAFTGALPIRLQWRHGRQPIPDATNATLSLTNVQFADDGEYTLIASNSFGAVESVQGALVILVRPVITVQPLSQSVVVGGSVTLSVSASGNPLPLSYRWRKGGSVLTNIIIGDTNCFFSITNVQPNPGTNTVIYSVIITNLAGSSSLSSNVVLTVLADSDGDGLPDEWETANGLSAADARDAALDTDGDGATNVEEYVAGTDPRDAQNHLRLEYARANDSGWTVRFLAVSNRTYALQARGGFSSNETWRGVANILAMPTNRTVELSLPMDASDAQRFLRAVTPCSP